MRGSTGAAAAFGGDSMVGPPLTDSVMRCESALMMVDQHSSASCCTKPRPSSVRVANIGKAVRKVCTKLNGLISRAAFEPSSSVMIERMPITKASSAEEAVYALREELNSGMAFMHCSVEFK